MKFFVKLFAVLLVVLGILIWLQSASEEEARPAPRAVAAAGTAEPVAAPASTMAMSYPAAAPVLTPAPAYTPAPPAAPPQGSQIAAAAQRVGLQLAGIAPQDGWLLVTVRGRDRNHVAEFLDAARMAGMTDVDLNYNKYTQFLAHGRMMAQATYRIRF